MAEGRSANDAGRYRFLIVALIAAIFISFVAIVRYQIAEGDEYQSYLSQGYSVTKTIEAARGDIVDRYGRLLATNEVVYDITIDKNTLPTGTENSIILELVDIMLEHDEKWIDTLPISESAPWTYTGTENQRKRLLSTLDMAGFATADDVVFQLRERYGLEDMDEVSFRRCAGVRYEMEREGYNYYTEYTFAENVSSETINIISEHSYHFRGVSITESYKRVYPAGDVAPHIIGLTGVIYQEEYENVDHSIYGMTDIIGKSGIEQAFESELKGHDGKKKVYYDDSGEIISEEVIEEPVPGKTVVATINSDLQRVAQEALEEQIINLRTTAEPGRGKESEGGTCVVIKVGTGEVLAAANYPSYDLSTYFENYEELSQAEYSPLFNRCCEGTYAIGSTFKPVVATAALQLGIINAKSTVDCEHVYTYYNDYQPTCLGHHGHINVIHALGYSCNIFFYETGRLLGIDNIRQYAYYYGLGEKTGIELYERTGQVSNPEYASDHGITWQKGDVLQTAIGQSYSLFSPVQMANYVATVANRGVRVNAHFVKSINAYDFSTIEETPITVLSDMGMTDYTYDTVLAGMLQSSQDSSGFVWSGCPIKVASKTGTPQTTTKTVNSTFICFAPADDPQIAIAVVIEKGWQGYTAAPVARDIIEYYFSDNTQGEASTDVIIP